MRLASSPRAAPGFSTHSVGCECHVADMPRYAEFDRAALAAILRAQERVMSRRQAFGCGMTRAALHSRTKPDGPWQRLMPGVYLAQTGTPTVPQQEMAALLHGGPGSVLTGQAALHGLGLVAKQPCRFDVLVPAARRPASLGFVAVHRTTRMPQRVIREGERRYALPPRAFADAARTLADLAEVRALIAGAVQRGDCPLSALARELHEGQIWDSARLRRVLEEVADGVRSVTEAEFRDLLKRARLPRPMFNPGLFTADGSFIARPDAWWPREGVAAEIDSREWHLSPADWQRTMRRHAHMSSHGILVLHFSPRQIRTDPATVAAAITDTLAAGAARPVLRLIARAAAA
jgi:hypothetical protein